MIIVEGPDGAGKTTLVNRLMEHPTLDLVRGERGCTSEDGALPELANWVDRVLSIESQRKVLYDRFPLYSDFAYGPLIRGYASARFDDFTWVHSRMNMLKARHNPMVIFCLPPKAVVIDNIMGSHEPSTVHLKGVLREIEAIYDLYVHQASMSPFYTSTWVWDYRKDNFADLCQAIRSYLGH
jgi:hypothetical protein